MQLLAPHLVAVDPQHVVYLVKSHESENRPRNAPLPLPVYPGPAASEGRFTGPGNRYPAPRYSVAHPMGSGDRCPDASTRGETGSAWQPVHTSQELVASGNCQQGVYPRSPRPLAAARRWLIRINAIQRLESPVSTSTTGHGHHIVWSNGVRQPGNGRGAKRRRRYDQNDELVHRGLVRGFQVLWHQEK